MLAPMYWYALAGRSAHWMHPVPAFDHPSAQRAQRRPFLPAVQVPLCSQAPTGHRYVRTPVCSSSSSLSRLRPAVPSLAIQWPSRGTISSPPLHSAPFSQGRHSPSALSAVATASCPVRKEAGLTEYVLIGHRTHWSAVSAPSASDLTRMFPGGHERRRRVKVPVKLTMDGSHTAPVTLDRKSAPPPQVAPAAHLWQPRGWQVPEETSQRSVGRSE
mmetsp:Transcript_43807/g.89488  ORF Transcript_43807/g.89488 Transcript_43807/m.89488 type:complete len:216 (-) Transcript_43807:533-1180(-)